MLALVVVCAVFFYISLYHVYKSCNPDTCVVFLILSIVFSVTVPFFPGGGSEPGSGDAAPADPGSGASAGVRAGNGPLRVLVILP